MIWADDPLLSGTGCTVMSLAAQPTPVTARSVSRHCLWSEGRGVGNLPWPRTIALDLCGTFLKARESLRGLRGHTTMGNVYIDPAQPHSQAWPSRGPRREVHRALRVCPVMRGAKVHSPFFKNVRLPRHHHPNCESLRFFGRPSDHTEWEQSFRKRLASQDLPIGTQWGNQAVEVDSFYFVNLQYKREGKLPDCVFFLIHLA